MRCIGGHADGQWHLDNGMPELRLDIFPETSAFRLIQNPEETVSYYSEVYRRERIQGDGWYIDFWVQKDMSTFDALCRLSRYYEPSDKPNGDSARLNAMFTRVR